MVLCWYNSCMKIKLNNVSVSFGENTVLKNINFAVNDNDKVALIGRNGCGKSTLIRVITGEQDVDSVSGGENVNSVEKIGSFKIGQIKQIVFDDENESLESEILKAYTNILNVKNQLNELEKILENNSNEKTFKTTNRKFKMDFRIFNL